MLRDASPGDRAEAISALEALGDLGGTRAERLARLAAMASEDNLLLVDAAADLGLILAEIPDRSLARDWTHLTREMASDLGVGPAEALARLDRTRRDLLSSALARTFLVASGETGRALAPRLGELAGYLDPDGAPPALADDAPARPIAFRLMEGRPESTTPVFVGLVNPNSQSGVFLHSAPLTSYADTDRESQLDYLSALLYGGGGAHSMFMKTWGAGLAYSNGIGAGAGTGRVSYYAERTPELPQTLRFVIGELRSAEPDPDLVEYAVAQAFLGTRAAAAFEDRGEAMARDLADGITPDLVARFRQGILDLRDSADLTGELYSRMAGVYARVLPGMGAPVSGIADGVYFVIGPESQIAAWEAYLRTVEGPETEVFRLYPRDFWMH
jgi:hypothetical protein